MISASHPAHADDPRDIDTAPDTDPGSAEKLTGPSLRELGGRAAEEMARRFELPRSKQDWEEMRPFVQTHARDELREQRPNAVHTPAEWSLFWDAFLSRWWEIVNADRDARHAEGRRRQATARQAELF